MSMKLKFKKLRPDAVLPRYAKIGDNGLDLVATSVISKMDTKKVPGKQGHTQSTFKYLEFGTSLAVEIPEGHVGLIFPRSSISDTSMDLANSVGVIDSNFRGEITFRFRTLQNNLEVYKVGDRVGQLLVIAVAKIEPEETAELSETQRGSQAYGSSGK
jgi:dUTP pyrophosphatase